MARSPEFLSKEEQKVATRKAVKSALDVFKLEIAAEPKEVEKPVAKSSAAKPPERAPSRRDVLNFIDAMYAPITRMLDDKTRGVYDTLFVGAISAAEFLRTTAKPPEMAGLSNDQWIRYLTQWVNDRIRELTPGARPAVEAPKKETDSQETALEKLRRLNEEKRKTQPKTTPAPSRTSRGTTDTRQPAVLPRVGEDDTEWKIMKQTDLLADQEKEEKELVERMEKTYSVPRPPVKIQEPLRSDWLEHVEAEAHLPTLDETFELFRKLRQLEQDLQQAKEREEQVSRGVRGALYGLFGEEHQVQARHQVSNLEHEELPSAQEAYQVALKAVAESEGRDPAKMERDFATRWRRARKKAEQPVERIGLVPAPPTRARGESAEMFQSRWAVWGDAAKSTAKALPRFAWGVLSVYLGVRPTQTSIQFLKEHVALKKSTTALQGLVAELEELARTTPGTAVSAPERVAHFDTVTTKERMLKIKLEELQRAGYLKEGEVHKFITDINRVVSQSASKDTADQRERDQQVGRILQDYFQRKATALETGKQWLNTGLLLSGWQLARAVGYGGLTLLQRAHRARADYEKSLRIEKRDQARMWDAARDSGVLKDITVAAIKEHARGLTGVLGPLFAGTPISKAEWAQRKMGFEKSLGALMIALGLTKVAHAEFMETGPSAQIDAVLDKLGKNGVATTLGNNYLHNIEQLSYGQIRFGKDGELKVAPHPDQGLAKPAHAAEQAHAVEPAPPAPVEKTEAELCAQAETKFFQAHPEYQRLEVASHGKIDVQGLADGEHIRMEMEFKGDIQQELRDIVTAVVAKADGKFANLQAAHAENLVANLTNLLQGNDLRFMEAEQLDGVAHLGDGKIVIDDGMRFHELLTKLKDHAEGKLTAANLAAHHELLSTVNNTSDANWQHDVNVGTGVSDAQVDGYVAVQLDHAEIHQAEVATAQQAVAELEISGAQVDDADITDEDNYTFQVGQAKVAVGDGWIERVSAPVGDDPTHTHIFRGLAMDDPKVGEYISNALAKMRQEAERGGHGSVSGGGERSEAAVSAVETRELPEAAHYGFKEVVRTLDQAGLVHNGVIQLGEVRFEQKWLDAVDEKSVSVFRDHPVSSWTRFFNAEKAHALEALASAMAGAKPGQTVGDFIVDQLGKLKNLRVEPETPGATRVA